MFNKINKPSVEELQSTIEHLEDTVKQLEEQLDMERADFNSFYEELNHSSTKCTPVVDFAAINAVSVERLLRPKKNDGYYFPETIIGYKTEDSNGNPILKEWYFMCSEEHHEVLAAQFNTYINSNKKGRRS